MVPRPHGSLERTPGALFRAMGALWLLEKPAFCREALARELREHLGTFGVAYHVRTLKRQLAGSVSSVPPEVEAAMRHLLLRADGLRTDVDIDKALRAAGLWVASEEREPAYVSSERVVPLAQLWLLFNPTRSRRSLAVLLSERLARGGIPLTIDPLHNILAGRPPLARREVHDTLLALLSAHGIGSEAEARRRWQHHQPDIAASLEDRALVAAGPLVGLARAWKLRNHQPSSRHLAVLLQRKLRERGFHLGRHQIQQALDAKLTRVRRALVVAMEDLLGGALPAGHDLASEVRTATQNRARLIDLCWVKAEPISALATPWLAQHPGSTMRQLAVRVAKSARQMGYATSFHTIQPILGGHKKRTRGFVYRAMLTQVAGAPEHVPEEHVIAAPWAARASEGTFRPPAEPKLSRRRAKLSATDTAVFAADPLAAYLRRARGHMVPCPEAQVELARRIEEAERDRLGVLCRSAVATGELTASKLDEGELSPWAVVIGARLDGEDANRQAHDALRRALGEISGLDALCEGARRELRSGEPTSEKRAAQLRQALEAEVQAAARRVATAQAEMVRSNLLVVVAIAKKYPGRGPDLPDLIQEGNIGLIRAVEKFDRAPPVRFLSTRSVGSIRTPATTLVRPAGTSWMAKAGCRGAIQIFFAPSAERPEVREVREAKARAICHTCPVMSPCRTWAREHREYGFWGGESEAERVAAGFRVAG